MTADVIRDKVTSIEVAKAAGVSQSTVSRTFSGLSVSAEKRQRVLDAAARLGYSPNAIARSLSMSRTNIVSIVMENMATSPFNPYVLEKFAQRLQSNGQQVLFFSVPAGQDSDALLPQVLQYQIDALILTSSTLSSRMVNTIKQSGIPIILFNRAIANVAVDMVGTDNVAGGRLVANALLDAGHKHFAYLAGPVNTSTNQEREDGFCTTLRERGVETWQREACDYDYRSGYAAAARLLQRAERPDAIFCASDVVALGVIDQARQFGIAIPDELSIVGFDDIPEAAWAAYDLTTVRQPVNRMVDATLNILQQRLAHISDEPQRILFPGTLIERATARVVLA